jgi:O-acetyl-ADP-ribose deacetylase
MMISPGSVFYVMLSNKKRRVMRYILRSAWHQAKSQFMQFRGQTMSGLPETVRAKIGQMTIELMQGNIVNCDVDAIVNAANSSLLGGGGVDGAIHRAAGKELVTECYTLNGCKTGDAKITKGYRLKARHVIHTVGPVYGTPNAPELLVSAYRRSLEVARENGLLSIAFPAVSTGAYGYPMQEAARIALKTICDAAASQTQPETIQFVLFDASAFDTFEKVLKRLAAERSDLMLLSS